MLCADLGARRTFKGNRCLVDFGRGAWHKGKKSLFTLE